MNGAGRPKPETRLLRFLRKGPARLTEAAGQGKAMLENPEHGSLVIAEEALRRALRDGLVVASNGAIALSDAGRAHDRRLAAGDAGFRAQHGSIDRQAVQRDGETVDVLVDRAESPLAALRRRKDADGRPFLSHAQFTAGERLRADFTRGNLMPRITANWEADVASGRRGGGVADLTDAALAARLRVEHAVAAVGPELGGVLVDVCCFLKGLETVERERRWPQRSAKIVLRTALSALDRHYHPDAPAENRTSGILHWGSSDFRPKIDA